MNKFIKLVVLPILATFTFSGCYLTTIDSTTVGVEKSWGEVQNQTIKPGLAFNMVPGVDLFTMQVKNKVANFAGQVDGADTATELNNPGITVLTEQQLPVPLDVSVMYTLNPSFAHKMLAEFGEDGIWDSVLIVKETRSSVRDAIGQVSLEKLNGARDEYENKIQGLMNSKLAKYGVTITNVAIRNIGIPKAIQEAVLAKETAKQNAEKAKYQVDQAKAEAEVEIAKAEGIAKANQALSSSLTQQLVSYKQLEIQRIQAEKWNGAMPTTVLGNNSNTLLNIK